MMWPASLSCYALRVAPQYELKVQAQLNQGEHPALAPVEYKWRRLNSRDRHKVRRPYPIFVRYVFVGLDDWRRRYAGVCNIDGVQGFLCRNKEEDGRVQRVPAKLADADVEFLMSLAGSVPLTALSINPHRAIQLGGEAQIIEGPLMGRTVKVEGIVAKRARVLMKMLGSMQVVEISVASLEAA